ncbi:unnamed protein product [Prorocentrum cordatum]|uniref:Uncharacterized protein n=1 Tax=Prorocentrum cordatum TaxID=2364126 RepID=A0ABN9VYH6_9DINO|nr:unnamed protein product [Polarella glacialis]
MPDGFRREPWGGKGRALDQGRGRFLNSPALIDFSRGCVYSTAQLVGVLLMRFVCARSRCGRTGLPGARPRPRRLPRPPRGIRGEVRGLRPRGSYEARPRDRALHATASLGQAHHRCRFRKPLSVGHRPHPSFRPQVWRADLVPHYASRSPWAPRRRWPRAAGSPAAGVQAPPGPDSEKAFQGCAASSGLPFRPASARRRLPRRGLVSLVQPLSQRRVPVRYTSRVLRAAFQFCIAGRSVLRGIKSIRLYEPSALSNLDLNFLRKQLS